jgi:hypothetical protein
MMVDYGDDPTGKCHYNGKEISKEAHTHSSTFDPSDSDIALKNKYTGMGHAIYYNGAFRSY